LKVRSSGIPLAFGGGIAAVVLYLTGSIAAWWFYPRSFTPRHNWLSDLGDPRRNPEGAFFYNVGCGLTALALLVFILGLSRWRRGRPRGHGWVAAAQVVGTVSAAALLMVGVFSTDHLRQHMISSNWFFASFPVFIALLSTGLYSNPQFEKRVAILGFGFLILSTTFHWLYPVSRVLEWVTELGFMVYVGLVAARSASLSP
jgi:hypothetical membrane protein